jgi:hypothetical protein
MNILLFSNRSHLKPIRKLWLVSQQWENIVTKGKKTIFLLSLKTKIVGNMKVEGLSSIENAVKSA